MSSGKCDGRTDKVMVIANPRDASASKNTKKTVIQMDKKTEVQMDKKTKTKKCVYDCDVRAVLHSWDVFPSYSMQTLSYI